MGASLRPRLEGEKTGKSPVDRGKRGTKRSLLTEGNITIGFAIGGATVHDKRLVAETIERGKVKRPEGDDRPMHFCIDRGYGYTDLYELLIETGYEIHLTGPRDEAKQRYRPGFLARRWVVERTHSWMNRFRRLLIRWEKKAKNYEAFLHFACAMICDSGCGVVG